MVLSVTLNSNAAADFAGATPTGNGFESVGATTLDFH